LAFDRWASTNALREEAQQELDQIEKPIEPFSLVIDEPVNDFKLFGASEAFDFSRENPYYDDETDSEEPSKKHD
jgi:hypothetical protein